MRSPKISCQKNILRLFIYSIYLKKYVVHEELVVNTAYLANALLGLHFCGGKENTGRQV